MAQKGLQSRRGAAYLMASLALASVIATSLAALVMVVTAHAARVKHQHDGLQALYLAEMGVEEMLARRSEGEAVTSLARVVWREVDSERRIAPLPDRRRELQWGTSGQPRPVIGHYETVARRSRGGLMISSRGAVATPTGRVVERQVHVTCRWTDGRWRVQRWEQGPW